MRQRITAAVLALVLVVFSVPVNEIACWAETIPENTEINIEVIGINGALIEEGIAFYSNDNSYSQIESEYDELDKTYSLDIGGLETDDSGKLRIIVRGDGTDLSETITQEIEVDTNDIQSVYTADMSRYIPLTLKANGQYVEIEECEDEEGETYHKGSVIYNTSREISIESDVDFALELEDESGASWDSEEKAIEYNSVGTITANLKYDGNDIYQKIYKDTRLVIYVEENIRFEMRQNKWYGDNVSIIPDPANGDLVGTVEVTDSSNNTWKKLNVTSDLTKPLAYKINDGGKDYFTIDDNGNVKLNRNKISGDSDIEATVTAYYKYNPDTEASYKLVYHPAGENIEVQFDQNVIENNGSKEITYQQGETYSITVKKPVSMDSNAYEYSYTSTNLNVATVDRNNRIENIEATLGEFQDNEAHVEYKQGEKEN
ncbi:MAG: hypothetical protein ACI4EU_01495 [Butyrivibrio sp.]